MHFVIGIYNILVNIKAYFVLCNPPHDEHFFAYVARIPFINTQSICHHAQKTNANSYAIHIHARW